MYPLCQRLAVHMPGGEQVQYEKDDEDAGRANLERIVAEGPRRTTLTAWFIANEQKIVTVRDGPDGQRHAVHAVDTPYQAFSEEFHYNDTTRTWTPRAKSTGIGSHRLGRLRYVSPAAGDEFYLRRLLLQRTCKGATSFEALRTVDGEVHKSFQAACAALGLCRGDAEYVRAIEEASHAGMPKQLRSLLVELLLCCDIGAPYDLYSLVEKPLMEDYTASVRAQMERPAGKEWAAHVASGDIIDYGDPSDTSNGTPNTDDDADAAAAGRPVAYQPDDLAKMAPGVLLLLDLERLLARHGRTLADTGLPEPQNAERLVVRGLLPTHLRDAGTNVLARSLAKDPVAQARTYAALATDLSAEQQAVVDDVFEKVAAGRGGCVFLTAEGGCGKTHTLRAIGTRVGGCQCAPRTPGAPAPPPCRACAAAGAATNPDAEDDPAPGPDDSRSMFETPLEEETAARWALPAPDNAAVAMDTDGAGDAGDDEATPSPPVGNTTATAHGTGEGRYTYQAVASSGIAAQVLGLDATTAHGAFKIPIAVDLQRHPRCNITGAAMRDVAAVLQGLDLIIWDEVSMQHRKAVEAVDRSLRDLMEDAAVAQLRATRGAATQTTGLPDTATDWGDAWRLRQLAMLPFGGKVVVFSGHWKQCLPIVHRGSKPAIKNACVFNCAWWEGVKVHTQPRPAARCVTTPNPIPRCLKRWRRTGAHAHGELPPAGLGHERRHGGARRVGGVPLQAGGRRHKHRAPAQGWAGRTGVRADNSAGGRYADGRMGGPTHDHGGGVASDADGAQRQRGWAPNTVRSPTDAAAGGGRGRALCVPGAREKGGRRDEPESHGEDPQRRVRCHTGSRCRDGRREASGHGRGEQCREGRD